MNETDVKEREEEKESPLTYMPPPYPEVALQDVKVTLLRVKVFHSLTLPFTAVPFTDEEDVRLEKVHPLRDVAVVMEESEEEGEMNRIDVLIVREEGEEAVTMTDSRERVPEDWKSNGQLSEERWKRID